jgi:hypothetical protein
MAHIEAQPPEGMPLLAFEVVQRPRDLVNGRAKPVEQTQARIGERNTPGRAVQQSNPETHLELPYLMTERGGRNA